MSPWLEGWSYRKLHNMYNFPSGAPYKYPMRFKIHYGSGVDNGEDVYLNGKCRSDFLDVRFTKKDGETLLDYWLERKVDGDYAVFWVDVEIAHPKVESGSWNIDGNTYRYRTKITVTERSGSNLTDYPVRIELNGKYLVKKGYATESGNEVRFTDSNGALLDFWRKSIFNTENAVFWVRIPSLNANETITIYIYYDANLTSVPRGDQPQNLNIWQLREHQSSPDYYPDIRFAKPTATVIRIDSYTAGVSSLGEGYVFLVVPKSFLHGKKLQIYWNGYFSYKYSRVIGWVLVVDAKLDRAHYLTTEKILDQFPYIMPLSYATITGRTGWMGWRLDTSDVLDLSSFTSEYVTIVIALDDGWIGQTVMIDVDYLNILDANDNLVKSYHFTETIIMETSGTYEDCGFLRTYVSPEPSFEVEVESEVEEDKISVYVYYGNPEASREDNPQDILLFQLREHQTDPDYTPDFRFLKPTGDDVRIDSYTAGISSLGEGFMFIIAPKSFLHGKRLQIYWNEYYSSTNKEFSHVAVFDTEMHRMQTLPIQSIFDTFTRIIAITYPASSATGWLGWRVLSSPVLDLSSFTSDYVTLVVYCGDAWTAQTVMLDNRYLNVLDENYDIVKTYYFNQSVLMEVTDTLEDYGLYRRYVSPEPYHETWGEEETVEVPPPPTGFIIDGRNIYVSSLSHGSTAVFSELDEMVESQFKHFIMPFGAFKPFTIVGFEDLSIPWSESIIKHLESRMRNGKYVRLQISHSSFQYDGYVWVLDLDFQTKGKIRIYRITLQEALS